MIIKRCSPVDQLSELLEKEYFKICLNKKKNWKVFSDTKC